jgi:3',5'-cyclic-AMP phosphodiesterase
VNSLKAAADNPIVFVVPGDLHLTQAGLENHRAALHVVGEINQLIKPDFVQFIGDNVQNAADQEFDVFLDLANRLETPWHALVGDHDVHDDREAVRFRQRIGPTYGSTTLHGVRFLRLNTQEAAPVRLSLEQINWLQTEVMSAGQLGERIIVFQHNYPYQIWEEFAGPGIDEWRALTQAQRIAAIFTGHTHYGQIANDGRNVCIATRSIGDPEGGPPGYSIAYLRGDDLAVAYRTVEDSGPLVLITHPRETLLATGSSHVVHGRDEVRARVWSERPVVAVRCRVDDSPWRFLRQAADRDWMGEIPGDRLSKGDHRLTVDACDSDGHCAGQAISFPVDATGRYTAVPAVRPAVFSTKFC